MQFDPDKVLDNFFSGHMIVDSNRKIIFCNSYICELSGLSNNSILTYSVSNCFTKASRIFLDSYIYPMLLRESAVQESQLSWVNKTGQVIPVVVNIKLNQEGISFWSVYICTNRDQLYTELIRSKEQVEEQADELFKLATTDSLTGLLNRRELENQIDRLIKQIARNPSTFALLTIDIDFFKSVNDRFGHQVGDKVLKILAEILTSDRRSNDLVGRTGGEGFVLVLPDVSEQNAFIIAENLREKIEEKTMDPVGITVSIGLFVSRINFEMDVDMIMNLSDQALYCSKNTGRNKTTVAQY